MDGAKLLLTHSSGGETQHTAAHGSQPPCVGASGQDVGCSRESGEYLGKTLHGVVIGGGGHVRRAVVFLKLRFQRDAVLVGNSFQGGVVCLQIFVIDIAQHHRGGADLTGDTAMDLIEIAGGAHHAGGSGIELGQHFVQQTAKQPQVGKQHLHRQLAVWRKGCEHAAGLRIEVADEDILEADIRITSQPPGKKLQNMMQLSGGEKALTAIALLFAIQNLKPSPFCLLDEIEAALDDSNVTRFAKYLHKLTKHTQFIVITHRRGTMSAAD